MYAIAIPSETPCNERVEYLMRARYGKVRYWCDDNDTIYLSSSLAALENILDGITYPLVKPFWYEVPFRPTGPVMYDYNNLKPIYDPR